MSLKLFHWAVMCERFNTDGVSGWCIGGSDACVHNRRSRHSAAAVQVVCQNAALWGSSSCQCVLLFMPRPTVDSRGIMYSGRLCVLLFTSVSCDEISLYLVDRFWWNLRQIITMSVGIARKVFKVKGQKSRSWPDQLTYNGGDHTGTCHQTFSGTCFSSVALEPHKRIN